MIHANAATIPATRISRKVSSSQTSSELRPRMPVLEAMRAEFGALHRSTVGLLGLQHLFASTATLIDTLAAQLPRPGQVYLLGKPYSTNGRVFASLQSESGFYVHPDCMAQPDGEENDEVMDGRIRQILRRVIAGLEGTRGRVVLIDDGGRAISMLHTPEFAPFLHRFTCVEQTRCGSRYLREISLQVPVVNVAECRAKLEHESPLIASSVNRELTAQLIRMRAAGLDVPRRAGVLGFGSIGAVVSEELRRCGYQVVVHDPDQGKAGQARLSGFQTEPDLARLLERGGIIIGCTGLPVVGRRQYAHIQPGSILISASSADLEFQAWNLRQAGRNLGRPEAWGGTTREKHPCFSLYQVPCRDGSFFLVNGGFPVNFNGGVDPIGPAEIQLTRTLLYIGAVQASRTTRPGLIDLDETAQDRLLTHYQHAAVRRAA
jgi:S-adenosylhomocysteine hydrolase